jgi:phage terminase large subunit GpA-like protein
MLASDPVPTLNQKKADLGIPRDSLKPHPALDAIPPEVLVVTCGVDCQDDRLECTFAGWSRVPGECFVLGHICIYGPITSDTVWQDMDG